jgi:hypothetical protein
MSDDKVVLYHREGLRRLLARNAPPEKARQFRRTQRQFWERLFAGGKPVFNELESVTK